ncbi:MAG: hypothetical protein M1832_001170 [Thelocarpon impressellum]|nr:MAG: hypothetical protein M1832_001170 [Thelocarpon impressellum]
MGRPGGRRGRLDSSTPEAARPSTASSSGGSYIDGWGEGTLMGGTGGRRGRPSSGGAGVGQSDDGLADNEFDHLIADNQQGFNDPNVAPLNATRTASRTASATIAPAGVSTPTASPSAATGVGATALADYLREATISEAEHWDEFWRDSDEEEYFESHENRTATIAGTNGTSQAGTPTAASPTDAAAPTATAGNGGGNQGGGADGELRHRKRGSVSCLSC